MSSSSSEQNIPWYRQVDSIGTLVSVSSHISQVLRKRSTSSLGILLGMTVHMEPGWPERSAVERLTVLIEGEELHLFPWTVRPITDDSREEEGKTS